MADPPGRFVWYELMTTDMEAATAFYTNVVGWGTRDASVPDVPYTLFTTAEISVTGVMMLPPDASDVGVKPGWIGYVGVDDVDAATRRLRQLGGAVHVPPFEIPGISRFSMVSDPQAAAFALFKWIEPGHEQPADLSMRGRVGWHELLADDRETALAFYSALFGWQKADAEVGAAGTYQTFSVAGQTVGGMVDRPTNVLAPLWLYYFNVGDIDAAARRVRAHGGQLLDNPAEVPGGNWIVQCTDPQGASFALLGKRKPDPIGFFKRAEPGKSSHTRFNPR